MPFIFLFRELFQHITPPILSYHINPHSHILLNISIIQQTQINLQLMAHEHYRPLIKLQHTLEHIFLHLDYTYSLPHIVKIKKYLPKIYSFFGVDAQQYNQSQQSLFEREKLKLKAVNGNSIVDDKPLKFYKDSQLETIQWSKSFLCVDIPFNSRQSEDSAKQELQSKLEALVQKTLFFRNEATKQIHFPTDKQAVKIKDITPFFEPTELNPQAFDNSYRKIRCELPLFIVLPKAQTYSVATLFQYIRDDVINSLKIMIKNQLPTRVVKNHKHFYLQSFIKIDSEREAEEKKLGELVHKQKEVIEQQPLQQNEGEVQKVEGAQQGSNRGLLAVLIALAVIYIYLKLNPLQKTLDDSL